MTKIKGRFAKTYDDFVKRSGLLPPGLEELVNSVKPSKILEFGVGTGTVAVGLSLKGYDVTGIDISEDMLRKARKKARDYSATTRFIRDDIVRVDVGRQFDLLLCLGNTLPIIRRSNDSRRLFRNCARHLKPGGSLIFQILNYDRILKLRPTTFATDITEGLIRVKQYRYRNDLIDFVVSLIDTSKIPPKTTISRGLIRPWTRREISDELKEAGFSNIRAYGDYSGSRFNLKSKDLILMCKR